MNNDDPKVMLARIAFQLSDINFDDLSKAEKNIIELLKPTGFIEIIEVDDYKETNLLPAATKIMRSVNK
jgi:hypothetical protein